MTRHTDSAATRFTRAASAGIVFGCLAGLLTPTLPAQDLGLTVGRKSFGGATDSASWLDVRFGDERARPAATGTTWADNSARFGPTVSAVDAALSSMVSGAGATVGGADRDAGIAGAIEPFTLEVVSPRSPALVSVGRLGPHGPRYSFTPQGLTVAWQASRPVNHGPDAFQWNTYLKQNLTLLACLHGKRILFEEKTRRGMREPLLRQWRDDIRAIPRSWGDGDSFATNYIGHPLMGAVMGYFEVFSHPVHARLEFGDRGYWKARGTTLLAAAVASTQFEIGPLSEATTGLHPSKQGLSDFIMTPVVGTAWIVGEDAIDHFVIARLEAGRGRAARALLRCALNPARTVANMVAFRHAWHRDTRAD